MKLVIVSISQNYPLNDLQKAELGLIVQREDGTTFQVPALKEAVDRILAEVAHSQAETPVEVEEEPSKEPEKVEEEPPEEEAPYYDPEEPESEEEVPPL